MGLRSPRAVVCIALSLIAACRASSSMDASPIGAAPPSGGGSDAAFDGAPSDGGTPLRDSATGDAADGAVDEPVPTSPGCEKLCQLVMGTCTDPEYVQFPSKNACLRACSYYPPGDPEDYLHNTLACRTIHASAQQLGHCHHAGAFGIDGCGPTCESFCQLAMGWCANAKDGPPFPSLAACMNVCGVLPYAPTRPDGLCAFTALGPKSGDTIDCRMYELVTSLESFADRDVHCPRAGTTSSTCK